MECSVYNREHTYNDGLRRTQVQGKHPSEELKEKEGFMYFGCSYSR